MVKEAVAFAKSQGSGWLDDKDPNPKNGKIEQNTSYLDTMNDWVVSCGVYNESPW
jgi:hypothetical protein